MRPHVKIKRHQPTRNMGSHGLKSHISLYRHIKIIQSAIQIKKQYLFLLLRNVFALSFLKLHSLVDICLLLESDRLLRFGKYCCWISVMWSIVPGLS